MSRGVSVAIVVGLLVSTLVVFRDIPRFEFVSLDDPTHLLEPSIQQLNWDSLWTLWTGPQKKLYVPVTYTIWNVLERFSEKPAKGSVESKNGFGELDDQYKPLLFHLTNLLFHLANVLLVFYLLKSLVPNGIAAACGAALFAWHPLQVEPVSWASGLKDLAAGFFSLLSVLSFLKFIERRHRKFYVLALTTFFLATLSKPSAVALPVVWIALGWFTNPAVFRKLLVWSLPSCFLMIPSIYMTTWLQSAAILPFIPPPLWARGFVAADAIYFYLSKLVWPMNLSVDYVRSPHRILQSIEILWTWILPAVLIGGAIVLVKRKMRLPLVCLSIFIGLLTPVLGFKPFLLQWASTVSDRYVYLSMLAPALLITTFVHRTKKVGIALSIALLVVLAGRSYYETTKWRNSYTLYERALEIREDAWLSANNLAALYEEHNLPERSIEYYILSATHNPRPDPLHRAAIMCIDLGRYDQVMSLLQRALQLRPGDPSILSNIRAVLARQEHNSSTITR